MRRKGREDGKKKGRGEGVFCHFLFFSLSPRILNRLEGDGKKVEGEGESSDKDSSCLFLRFACAKKGAVALEKGKGPPIPWQKK